MDNHNVSSSSSSSQYRSQISPRISSKNNIVTKHFNSSGIPLKSNGKSSAVITIQENREREKRELSDLNDRFASYIERVRFLEAQNRKLQFEIDHLQGKWGSQTNKVKEKYEVEIREARHIIDDRAKDRATAELRVKHAEEETLKLKDKYEFLLTGRDSDRQKIELLQKQLLDNETDLNLFRRRLIDLEDEQKHYRIESQKLILDIQRITKDLDNETLARIKLENQKQNLEEEVHFLKEIYSQEIEELKQANLIDTTLDLTNFFKHKLSNAVKNIREEYEQLNQQQRNEFESWYRLKVTQAMQEIQSYQAIENLENIREQEEIKKLRTSISDSRQNIDTIRQRNEELENRIRELEKLIQIERNDHIRALDERDRKIKDLRTHLEDLGRDYDELISMKSSLDSEITIYRKLLEGEEKREGLKQIISSVEEQARTNFPTVGGSGRSTTYSYSQSYRRKTGSGNNDFMLTTYVPLQSLSSTRIESTIFEQVYGDHPRRPTTISLNVQWIPTVDRSNSYGWNQSDINSRKFKTKTFFETGRIREQQQPKAVTPPSSDYTDAYLSAFAPKLVPTRYIHRITTPVFATVAPIPFRPTRTYLSTNTSIRTSQTRFNTINNLQTSNSFDKIVPSIPSSSSTYSSSFIPDISTEYKPFSSTQSFAPETQTFNSDYTTSLRNTQPSETTIHASPRPSPPSTLPDSLQLHPSSTPTSLSSPSPTSTYKPSVLFQSAAPTPLPNDIHQSSTNKPTVLLSSNTEKSIDRPETLLFQHDEDIRSSCIEKPSPIITPLLESPITRVETKIEPEHTSTEELTTTSSKPIGILENTLSKYDSIIGQISEILASVSPLSSTVSSISPGTSVLDYELTSDGSPILQHKRIEPQSLPQSTASVRNTNIQRVKGKHLIREDSYDKIITAIADLDSELTPPPDIQKSTTVIEEETEESITPSVEEQQMSSSTEQLKDEIKTFSFDDYQTPSLLNEKKKEAEVLATDEQQLSSVIEREEDKHEIASISPSDVLTSKLLPLNETKLDEEKFINVQSTTETSSDNAEFVQPQTRLLSNILRNAAVQEETSESCDEVITTRKKNKKHVTWRESVVDNEDDESSSYQSLTEESSSSETPITITKRKHLTSDESTTVVEQQMSTSTSFEEASIDDQVNSPTSSEPSSSVDQEVTLKDSTELQISSSSHPKDQPGLQTTTNEQVYQRETVEQQISPSDTADLLIVASNSTKLQPNLIERRIKFSSPLDTSSSFSDSVDRQTNSSDLNESESSHDEQVTSSSSSSDTQFVSGIDSFNKNLVTVDKRSSTTISDVDSKENIEQQVEEIESNKTETFTQLADNTESEARTSAIKSTALLALPIIVSPINTIADTISTRYISSDVYHGYLGEHTQFIESPSDIDTENMKISLLTSLRQTIASPVAPLIETIQSVVSSTQTITATQPLKNESEMIDNSQNETSLATAAVTDSKEKVNQYGSPIEENQQTVHDSEESKTIFKSLHDTVTKNIQTIVSNLQADKQKDLPISSAEKIEPVSEESISTEDMKNLTTLESTPSSSFDSIQEKISDTITTLTEAIENVISTDIPSTQTQIKEEQIVASSPLNTLHEESIDNPVNTSVDLTSQITVATPTNEDKEQTAPDTNTIIVEQIENRENAIVESPSSEILTLSSVEDTTTKSIPNKHEEQISIENVIPSEYINTVIRQEIIDKASVPSELVETTRVDQKTEELPSAEAKIAESIVSTSIVQDDEQVLTTNAVSSERIDTEKKEVTHVEIVSEASGVTISEQKTDEIKTSLDDTTHPLATITEKIESVISSSSTEVNLPSVEHVFAPTNDHTNTEQVASTEISRDQPFPSQEKEQILTAQKSEIYPENQIQGEEKISPSTLLSQVFEDDIAQLTTYQQLLDAVPLKNDEITTEKTNTQIISTSPIMSEVTSTLETDELTSASNKENKIIHGTMHEFINNIIQTVISELQQNSIETNRELPSPDSGFTKSITTTITPPIDDGIQRSATECEFDSTSVKTEIENISSKPSTDFRELSPTNTEPNSLELIHALQGHSIVLPNSSEHVFHPPEKSSSSTTSSQITSSNRYVSYAIHEMSDLSQDRLPAIPIAADIPIYKNIEENGLVEPIIVANQSIAKEDDSTEFDASDNLTSYSDDILLQRLQTSATNREKNLDASSTDDDVDDEIEQHDLTDIHHIIDKLTEPSISLNANEGAYQRYDLATTSSSNDSSSSSRQQPDDVYFIPGYTGLWRPSADNDNANLPIDYDADDERKTATKTRNIVRISNSARRPLTLRYHQGQTTNLTHPEDLTNDIPLQPETKDIFNRPLNEFSFDISESDSYHTCPSSISKQQQQQSEEQHQESSDENIFLICERERGSSLPVTVKINCDDIALRLSTSTPIDTQLYSTIQPDLSSPSAHNEPPLPEKTDSNSRASSPSLSSNENDLKKLPSWLNTINTVTTTTEGSDGQSHITLLKSAKGPISISECHPQGNYIIIDNTSRSKNIDLTNWIIRQENDNGNNLFFTFPDNCFLRPNHSLKILTKTNESEQRNDDLIASSLSSWHTGSNIITTLINPEGKDRATLTKKTIFS